MPSLKRLRVSNAPRLYKKAKRSTILKSPISRILSSISERKYLDTFQSAVDFLSTYPNGLTYGICSIAEGNDYNQRVGRSIKMSYVVVDLYAYMDAAAVPTTAIPFSFHVLIDKQPNGALISYNEAFDLTVINNGYAAFKNLATNDDRVHILKTISGGIDLNGTGPYRERFYIKIPEALSVSRYAGTTATYPQTNNLVIAVAANESSPSDSYYRFSTRVVFTDN